MKPLFDSSTVKYAPGQSPFLVLAALLLAHAVRLADFARRKEIGIMRLVGASTFYITLPFVLEALATAVLGVALAAGALGAVMCSAWNNASASRWRSCLDRKDRSPTRDRHRILGRC